MYVVLFIEQVIMLCRRSGSILQRAASKWLAAYVTFLPRWALLPNEWSRSHNSGLVEQDVCKELTCGESPSWSTFILCHQVAYVCIRSTIHQTLYLDFVISTKDEQNWHSSTVDW